MKTKALTAAQIDCLAQRLSETPIEPSASAKKAGDNLARLLADEVADVGADGHAIVACGKDRPRHRRLQGRCR